MNDIEAIRERHTPYDRETYYGTVKECSACLDGWRCDTRVVLDALDELAALGPGTLGWDYDTHRVMLEDAWSRVGAARADADRLASALRAHWNARCEEWDDRDSDALRQHDKAAKVVA